MADPVLSFIDVAALAALVRVPASDFTSGFGKVILDSVESAIRDEAGHPEWVGDVGDPATVGLVEAPARARIIGLWVAKRAFEHPGNRERRTSGPISTSWKIPDLQPLEFTSSELDWLHGRRPGERGGLWVQKVGTPRSSRDIYLPDERPLADPILMDDGSTGFMYGVDDG